MDILKKQIIGIKQTAGILLYAVAFIFPVISAGNPLFGISNINGVFISEFIITIAGLMAFGFVDDPMRTIQALTPKQWIVIAGAFLYASINVIAMFGSINMFESEGFVYIYINGFLLLTSTYLIFNKQKLDTLLFILAVSSTAVALYGIYQTDFWYRHILETNAILNHNVSETAKNTFRALGTFIHPNVMAGFLLMVIPPVYMLLIKSKYKLLLYILALIITLGLFVTYSRAAIALYILSLPFLFMVLKKENGAKKVLLYISTVILLAVLILVFIISSYNSLNKHTLSFKYAPSKLTAVNDMSFIARKDFAIGAIDIIRHHPWTGTGPGTFNIAYRMYQKGAIYSRYAHNNYLEMASEIGIPGLTAYLVLIAGMLLSFGSAWKRGSVLAGVLLISVVSFMMHTSIDFDYASPAVVWLVFIYAGISLILSDKGYANR